MGGSLNGPGAPSCRVVAISAPLSFIRYAIKIMLEARKTFGTFPPLVDVTVCTLLHVKPKS